ncbi:ABC transporter permease [Arthrobacter sp. alpha11c]
MGRYTVRRLIQMVFVFFGVTLIIYAAVWALPGDPIRALSGNRPMSESTINSLREQFHLNDPFYMQYFTYVGNLMRGDLGTDFNGRSVAQQMGSRWPVTINLALTALLFEAVIGIALGTIAAVRGKITDYVILFFSIGIISLPVFVLAYMGQILLGVKAGIFPVSGIGNGWMSYILPGFILATTGMASVARLVRSSVLENLKADYTRTAHAKGLSNFRVLTRHVLRNSLVPAVTFLAIDLGYLMGGAIVIEGVFNLPGIGQLLFRATAAQEGAVVVGVASLLVLIFLLTNLLVDLLYGVLDPRIRYE